MDWTYQQGGKTSGHLGPTTDHTYGTEAGTFNIDLLLCYNIDVSHLLIHIFTVLW